MPRLGPARVRDAIDPSPRADEPLDVRRRAGECEIQQCGFILGGGHTGDARTLVYDNCPHCIEALTRGKAGNTRATRTFSRAAPRSMPVRQCAQERKPLFHPVRASNSASSTSSS